jgi:hypothetical protein
LDLELVRVNFLYANATVPKVTATITTFSKMSASALNSGTVGVGDTDVAGAGDADESEESDITETVLETKLVMVLSRELVTNISLLPES